MKFDWKASASEYVKTVMPGVCFWTVIFMVGLAGTFAFGAFVEWLGLPEFWRLLTTGLFTFAEFIFICGCVDVYRSYRQWKRDEAKRREFFYIAG